MSAQIVIRSRDREAYFGTQGEWCERMVSARTFASATEAEEVCRKEKLKNAEIIVLRPDRPPMRIPVGFAKDANEPKPLPKQESSRRLYRDQREPAG